MTKRTGILYAIFGAIFWGASGTVAEYLFQKQDLAAPWLVGVRLFFAGLLLLTWFSFLKGKALFSIWKSGKSIRALLFFSFCGMLPSQLTYFLAINYGNAPTATVLQFLGPLFIIGYLAAANRELPRRIDVISVVLALLGTFLLVTSGHLTQISLAPFALFWGIMAGLSQAAYTLLPRWLLAHYDAPLVVGWSMLLSSLPFIGILWRTPLPDFNVGTISGIGFIILFGTMLAYLFYLKSLTSLSPSTTGMLSSFEPLTATILSITFLSTPFSLVQCLGGLCVLSTTFLQAWPKKKSLSD